MGVNYTFFNRQGVKNKKKVKNPWHMVFESLFDDIIRPNSAHVSPAKEINSLDWQSMDSLSGKYALKSFNRNNVKQHGSASLNLRSQERLLFSTFSSLFAFVCRLNLFPPLG